MQHLTAQSPVIAEGKTLFSLSAFTSSSYKGK